MNELNEHCTLCLSTNKKTIDIFGDDGKILAIAEIISKHFWIQVNESSKWHKKICTECWTATKDFHKFYNFVEVVHRQFFENIAVKAEESEELSNDGIAMEPFGYDNNLNNSSEKDDSRALIEDKRLRILENKTKSKTPNNRSSGSFIKEEKISSDIDKDRTITSKPLDIKKQKRLNEDIKIAQLFKMHCDLCDQKFGNFSEARQHYRLEHKINGYLKCCNKKFIRRQHVVDHIDWHWNPNLFECLSCNKRFSERRLLTTHMLLHTTDETEKFECSVCRKRFVKIYLLNVHMKKVHPANAEECICDYCQKTYRTKTLILAHMVKVHRPQQRHICDICATTYKNIGSLRRHLIRAHSDVKEPKTFAQCDICGASVSKGVLSQHKRRHINSPKTCPVCFSVKRNQISLTIHMRTSHGEAKHQCNICFKSFRRKRGLVEHMASHTGHDLYTCLYCPKTFKASTNKYKHQREVHTEQWQLDRKRQNYKLC